MVIAPTSMKTVLTDSILMVVTIMIVEANGTRISSWSSFSKKN